MSSRGTAASGRAIAGFARIKAAETSMILDIDGFLLTVGSLAINHTAPIPPRVVRDRMERSPTLRSFRPELTASSNRRTLDIQGPSPYASPPYSPVHDAG